MAMPTQKAVLRRRCTPRCNAARLEDLMQADALLRQGLLPCDDLSTMHWIMATLPDGVG
jgi:hypothetical protein